MELFVVRYTLVDMLRNHGFVCTVCSSGNSSLSFSLTAAGSVNVVRYSLFVAAEYEIYRLVHGWDGPGNISFRFIEPRVPNPGGSCSRARSIRAYVYFGTDESKPVYRLMVYRGYRRKSGVPFARGIKS